MIQAVTGGDHPGPGVYLGFDCSSPLLSIALRQGDYLFQTTLLHGLHHGEDLFPGIEFLLSRAGLDTIQAVQGLFCALGPGSFTGLRIGLAAARGIASGLDIPVCGVDSFQAMALPYLDQKSWVLSLMDGRKSRYYCRLCSHTPGDGPCQDLSLERILTLLRDQELKSPGGMICHPPGGLLPGDRHLLHQEFPGLPIQELGSGWMPAFMDLGLSAFHEKRFMTMDQGPEYLRHTHEDLGIHLKGF